LKREEGYETLQWERKEHKEELDGDQNEEYKEKRVLFPFLEEIFSGGGGTVRKRSEKRILSTRLRSFSNLGKKKKSRNLRSLKGGRLLGREKRNL